MHAHPTAEQQQAIDLFRTGDPLAVEAGAGTGKTTTLAMMARDTPRTGTYLAFNREIAREAAAKMPQTVDCRTVHSAAISAVRRHYPQGAALLERLGGERIKPYAAAKLLGLGPIVVTVPLPLGGTKRKVLQPGWLAGHVQRAIAVFCQSADPEPTGRHFPYIEGIDMPGPDGARTYTNNDLVAKELEPFLLRAWADLTRPTGQLRFSHDIYVKLAQLAGYPLAPPSHYVLFDEAQDASPVMLAMLANHPGQVVYVGDSQQQIYEWRGAVNALGRLADGTARAWLTQSWRFGPAVAEVANLALAQLDAELRLTGTPNIDSQVLTGAPFRNPRAVLCRTNAVAVQTVLNYQQRGQAPHLVGGADDIVRFAQSAQQLMDTGRTGHPELSCFDSWREVQDYVEHDPAGSDLKMLVKLLTDYGTDIVIEALSGLAAQQEADVVISTAHKAKGREWPSVRLTGDFEPDGERELAAGEWRLLYVAATRGQQVLDLSTCAPLRDLL